MHILLIEPDYVLATIFRCALEQNSHTVITAASSQQAVHFADQRKPDVVVLEMDLPRHNGVEFLYEFRSYSEWLDVPVVIHSFVPPEELAAPTLRRELGVVRLLYKPATSLVQLCMAVDQVVPMAPKL